MRIINVSEVGSTEVEEMQSIHEKEVSLINEIDEMARECVEGSGDTEKLAQKLDEYIVHVKEHFRVEEELMREYNFPSYDLHEMAHQMFLADLQYATKHWKELGDLNKIVAFVRKSPEWIVSHIDSVDIPTAEYIAKKRELVD